MDMELLELAARAAGNCRMIFREGTPYVSQRESGDDFISWNPLTDDGDALRLAVATGLLVDASDIGVSINVQYITDGIAHPINEEVMGDPCDATRRAIVRAAAEIGRAMKGD